jgi:hypothetical protein
MATVAEQAKPGPVTRFDSLVDAKLAKAEARIRGLDTITGLLGFAIGTLCYALVVAFLDRWLDLPIGVRLVGFLAYAGISAAWLGYWIVRPYLRSVNPYFAARRMEEVIPESKNSVVNWLDLHQEPLPPSIKGAVGQRAAQDLGKVDLEEAIDGRHTVWLGVSTLILGLILFMLLVFVGLPQFRSLMERAFFPFQLIETTHRTRLTMKTGDVTVPVEQPAIIVVGVEGTVPDPRQPDALKLFLRYRDSDPYEDPILLEQVEAGRLDWQAIVPASRVRNGFLYKVKGGDDETGEYRVTVHTSPLINRFEAKHHYRKYLGWPDRTTYDPNLHDMVATEIGLTVRTNRVVRTGSLELTLDKERKSIPAQPVKEDPQALLFRFPLEKSGHYGIRFTSADGENYSDSMHYSLTVTADEAPHVKLTKPGIDVTLPANGMLQLEGDANDDVGVKAITLRMQVVDGPVLEPKKYREGDPKKFLLTDGSYPKALEYKDFVDFTHLKDAQGGKVTLQPNKVLEYWLEAEDNCEPDAHTGVSDHFKVVIAPPENNAQQQQQDREQAKQNQKKHEQKQDDKLKNEGEQRKEDAEKKPGNQGGKDNESKPESKPDQPKDGSSGDTKDPKKGDRDQKNKEEQDKIEKKLKEEMEKEQKSQEGSQDSKDDSDKKGDVKNDPAKQPKGAGKDQGKQEKDQKGDGKGEGKQDDQSKEKSQPKDAGDPKGSGAQDKAMEKGEGKPGPNESKGDAKDQKGDKQDNAAVKNEGKPETKPSTATDKAPGTSTGGKDQATAKDEGRKPDPKNQPAEAKDADGKPKTDGKPEGVAKGEKPSTEKADKKDGGKNSAGPEEAKATPKDDKQGDGTAKADDKQSKEGDPTKGSTAKNNKATQGAKREDPKELAQENRGATPEDVEKLAKDAQGAGAQKQRETAEKLDQIRHFAGDSETRAAADRAHDKLVEEMAAQSSRSLPQKEGDSQKDGKPDDPKRAVEENRGATPEDVDKLAKEAQGADEQKQRDIAKKLDQIGKYANDPKARDAADKALDKLVNEATKKTAEQNHGAKPDDVDKLAKEAQGAGQQKQSEIAKKLDQISKHADDPKAREAADKALDKLVGEAMKKTAEQNRAAKPEEVDKLAKEAEGAGEKKQREVAKKLDDIKKSAEDPKTREAAEKALRNLQDKATKQNAEENRAAKPEDADKLAKEAQRANMRRLGEIIEQLESMRQSADDPKAREAAKKALREIGDQMMKRYTEECRGATPEDVEKLAKKAEGADEQKRRDIMDKLSNIRHLAEDLEARQAANRALDKLFNEMMERIAKKEPPPKESDPNRGTGNEEKATIKNDQTKPPPAGPGDSENLKKSQLQLENIRKLLKEHPEIIDKSGLTKDQVDHWVQEKQQEIDDSKREHDKTDDAKKPGIPLPNLGAKLVKPADATSGNTNGPGTAAPPPEFRDMYYKKFIGDKKPGKP